MNPAISVSPTKEAAASGGVFRLVPGFYCWPCSGTRVSSRSSLSRPTASLTTSPCPTSSMSCGPSSTACWCPIPSEFPRPSAAGVDTYEFWLKIGIVFLGVRFLLGDVLKLGGLSLGFVAIELAVSIALMTWLGRLFGTFPKLAPACSPSARPSAESRPSSPPKEPLRPTMRTPPTPWAPSSSSALSACSPFPLSVTCWA